MKYKKKKIFFFEKFDACSTSSSLPSIPTDTNTETEDDRDSSDIKHFTYSNYCKDYIFKIIKQIGTGGATYINKFTSITEFLALIKIILFLYILNQIKILLK